MIFNNFHILPDQLQQNLARVDEMIGIWPQPLRQRQLPSKQYQRMPMWSKRCDLHGHLGQTPLGVLRNSEMEIKFKKLWFFAVIQNTYSFSMSQIMSHDVLHSRLSFLMGHSCGNFFNGTLYCGIVHSRHGCWWSAKNHENSLIAVTKLKLLQTYM